MLPQSMYPSFLDGVPVIRFIWRRLLERGLEVRFHEPTYHLPPSGTSLRFRGVKDEPLIVVMVNQSKPYILAWLDCEFINHRTDRKELILSASLHLKRKRLLLWSKTLSQTDFAIHDNSGPRNDPRLNIELAPMSKPLIVNLRAEGPISHPIGRLPKRMTLEIEFRLVGPIRTMRRRMCKVNHDPKTVSDVRREQS